MVGDLTDNLIIGYDKGEKDITCMVIGRKDEKGYRMINALIGREAEEVYDKLTGADKKEEDRKNE